MLYAVLYRHKNLDKEEFLPWVVDGNDMSQADAKKHKQVLSDMSFESSHLSDFQRIWWAEVIVVRKVDLKKYVHFPG